MQLSRPTATLALFAALAGCSSTTSPAPKSAEAPKAGTLTKRDFGKTADGAAVDLYTLTNSKGMEASIMTYGAIIVTLKTPDRSGAFADVTHGFDTLDGYLKTHPYFGAIVGRYGNRIAKGRFKLKGVEYKLATNDGANSLHGGVKGFDKVVWTAKEMPGPALQLTYVSKDGEEGYPGELTVQVTYTLTENNELKIEYASTAGTKDTVANITNHAYFNLSGEGDILAHEMKINADRFTPVDKGLIPTGELRKVDGTPFDFTKPTAIGARINQDDEQLKFGKGYDHNWVLTNGGGSLTQAAEVYDPKSGRVLEVWTTEPAVQFYTGNFLDGTITGKGGRVYALRSAFCLETQHYPDSPNHPDFPPATITAGQTYKSSTVFRFSAR